MKKRILFLPAALIVGIGVWIVAGSSRSSVAPPTALPSKAARLPRQQEPVGWVFGRLFGVQHSVYTPSGPVIPLQGQPLPQQRPSRGLP